MKHTDPMNPSTSQTIVLLYFKGCPNVEKARRELRALRVDYLEVCQDDLGEDDPRRNYSSPSILWDGRILLGEAVNGSACCTYGTDVDYEQLRDALSPKRPKGS